MKRLSPSSLSRFARCLWSLLPVLLLPAFATSARAQWTQKANPDAFKLSDTSTYVLDGTHAYTVAVGGIILFWDGTAWIDQTAQNPNTNNLNCVFALDATHIWAAGGGNTFYILFNNGTTWSPVNTGISPGPTGFRGIWAADSTHLWTVGFNGYIARLNGTTWAQQTNPNPNGDHLNGVWGTDVNHVWAVGGFGTVLFWNGTAWAYTDLSSTNNAGINAVHGVDANHVWAVGNNGVIWFWNGSTWTVQASGTTKILSSVWAQDANNVWAVGASTGTTPTIIKFNGTTWAPDSPPAVNVGLNGIHGSASAGYMFAVGNSPTTGVPGVLFQRPTAAAPSPSVTVPGSTTTLTTTTSGTAGASVNFSITGANLTGSPGSLTVTAPTNVQVSADNSTWGGTASIPYSAATLASTPVYARLAGTGTVGTISGNVSITGGGLSAAVTQAVSGTLNAAPTTITSLNRVNTNPSNASTVNWTLTFAAAVTNVTSSNFLLTGAAAAGASVGTPTTSNNITWNVPVNTGGTDGILTLSVANATNFSPGVSTTLPFNTVGQTYLMDKTPPTILSINRQTPSGQNTGSTTVTFRVIYSEAVTGVTNSSFALVPVSSSIVGSVTGVSFVTPATCDVTVNITSGTGEFRLRGVN